MTNRYEGMPPERVIQRVFVKLDQSSGPDSCWLWPGARLPRGYGVVGWSVRGRVLTDYIHRVVLMHKLNRPLLPGEESKHTCDNPPCGNPRHLVPGSHASNMQDMVLRSRSTQGERHPSSRLTETDVLAIRKKDVSARQAALAYGVTPALIYAIRSGRLWRHL